MALRRGALGYHWMLVPARCPDNLENTPDAASVANTNMSGFRPAAGRRILATTRHNLHDDHEVNLP